MAISKATYKGQVVKSAERMRRKTDPIESSGGMLKGKTSLLKALMRDRREEAKRG